MTFLFLTNLVNHHQIHLADELYKKLGNNYIYVAFEPLPDWLKKGGYQEIERPYVLRAYESTEKLERAKMLANTSDIVMIGSAPETLVQRRLKANMITFHYSERWFKKGYYPLLSPKALYYYYMNHTRYRNKRSYMLCASAYTASDVHKVYAYPNKCYKWGYFTKVDEFDVKESLKARNSSTVKILWTARFLQWKKPERMLQLALFLKERCYDFEINMIGNGELYEHIKSNIAVLNLEDKIHLLGNKPNNEVCKIMRQHHIFCFTSDRNEGWGTVLNESMANGCCPVASNEIGSVPFLIQDGYNGLIYKQSNLTSLCEKVDFLINNPVERERMAINAYYTLKNVWSPKHAANNLLQLSSYLLNNTIPHIQDGPCSHAL